MGAGATDHVLEDATAGRAERVRADYALTAELAALEAPKSPTGASTGPQSSELPASTFVARLRPLAPWLLAALAIVALVVMLAR
jgi:hypothetical protein